MANFFTEIEFKTLFDNHYWFPLFLTADSLDQAEENTQAVVTALNENYIVKRSAVPRLYIPGLTSEYIDEYIANRLSGKLAILQFRVWRFKDFIADSTLNFTENLNLVNFYNVIDSSTIASVTEQHNFPVRQLLSNQTANDFDDFLLINVVRPAH